MDAAGTRSDVNYDLVAYYFDFFFGDDEEWDVEDDEWDPEQLKLQEEEDYVSGRLEADVNAYYETIECAICTNEPVGSNEDLTRKRKRDD